jgi:hypothetical protein
MIEVVLRVRSDARRLRLTHGRSRTAVGYRPGAAPARSIPEALRRGWPCVRVGIVLRVGSSGHTEGRDRRAQLRRPLLVWARGPCMPRVHYSVDVALGSGTVRLFAPSLGHQLARSGTAENRKPGHPGPRSRDSVVIASLSAVNPTRAGDRRSKPARLGEAGRTALRFARHRDAPR